MEYTSFYLQRWNGYRFSQYKCRDIFFSLNRYIQEEWKSFHLFVWLSAFKRRIFIQPLSKSLRQEWISKPFDYVNGCLTLLLAFGWCSLSFEFFKLCAHVNCGPIGTNIMKKNLNYENYWRTIWMKPTSLWNARN